MADNLAPRTSMSYYGLLIVDGSFRGLTAAKRAAHRAARVAIAGLTWLGGACSARGCIPKIERMPMLTVLPTGNLNLVAHLAKSKGS